MKSTSQIIGNLLQGVEERNIDWEIFINKNTVRARYICPLTAEKNVSYKILYDHSKPENTKLSIDLQTKKGDYNKIIHILTISKENENISIIKEITTLLEKILDYHDLYKKNQNNNDLNVGDRVIVVKPSHFKGSEVGKKGIIVEKSEMGNYIYYTVCFDIKFSKDLAYHKKAKKENCWLFKADDLEKIKLNSTWTF